MAQHSLEQLNADPALLAETFKPALTETQQASDLRHIAMCNHVTRKFIEPAYQLWCKVSCVSLTLFICTRLIFVQHRGLTMEEVSAARDYPLYNSHPTFKMQIPLSYNLHAMC